MENDAGEFVDLYCPRKCSASNRIIHAKDHASIQLVIAEVDPTTGQALDTSKMYAICGPIRRMGESDDCLNRLTKADGTLPKHKPDSSRTSWGRISRGRSSFLHDSSKDDNRNSVSKNA